MQDIVHKTPYMGRDIFRLLRTNFITLLIIVSFCSLKNQVHYPEDRYGKRGGSYNCEINTIKKRIREHNMRPGTITRLAKDDKVVDIKEDDR